MTDRQAVVFNLLIVVVFACGVAVESVLLLREKAACHKAGGILVSTGECIEGRRIEVP